MVNIVRIRLTQEECSKLAGAMTTRGLSQNDLANLLGISQGTVTRVMTGKSTLKCEYAKKIYDIFNHDSSLNFLVNYELEQSKITETEKAWNVIYQGCVVRLRSIYHNQSPEQKGIVINELEKIIGKYEQS